MIVRLRGVTKIAKENGLYVVAVKINDNVYITGQGIVPGNKETEDGLTLREMTGEDKLSEEKNKKYPFIIEPYTQYKFADGYKFDSESPEGKAYLDFIESCAIDKVASSKSLFISGKHSFYLENKVVESKVKNKVFSNVIKAGSELNSLSRLDVLDLADYIYVTEGDVSCKRGKDYEVVFNTLSEYAMKTPLKLLNALSPENKNWMKVSNLVTEGVITSRNGEFFEGNTFIASNFETLVENYISDIEKHTRWEKKLKAKQGNVHVVFDEPEIDINGIKASFMEAIINNDDVTKAELTKVIKTSGNSELMEMLVKYSKVKIPANKEQLLDIIDTEHFQTFKKKFLAEFPSSELTTKEDIRNFLNNQS